MDVILLQERFMFELDTLMSTAATVVALWTPKVIGAVAVLVFG
jgi:hypothetical protein